MIRQDWSTLKKLMFMKTAAGGGAAVEATATGNPLTFLTDLARQLKSLLIPFTPVQSGTGDPSPQNIRSILPWNGLKVFGGGKNLIQDNKNLQQIFMPKGTKLFASIKRGATSSSNPSVTFYTENKTIIDYWTLNNAYMDGRVGRGFTLTDDVYWFSIVADDANALERQLEIGTSGSAYEPYKPITETDIPFASPVYGGTLDVVSGVLTVQRVSISKKWSEWESQSVGNTHTRKTILFNDPVKGASTYAWSRCNVAPQDWNTSQNTHFYIDENIAYVWLPNETDGDLVVQVAGVLVTPQEIQLTPAQITALVGDNTIWSDADGSMTATYLKKG